MGAARLQPVYGLPRSVEPVAQRGGDFIVCGNPDHHHARLCVGTASVVDGREQITAECHHGTGIRQLDRDRDHRDGPGKVDSGFGGSDGADRLWGLDCPSDSQPSDRPPHGVSSLHPGAAGGFVVELEPVGQDELRRHGRFRFHGHLRGGMPRRHQSHRTVG